MRVALLPDTRPEAGLGHLRRCQALASALERLGCECVWPEPDEAYEADALVVDHYEMRTAPDYKAARRMALGTSVIQVGRAMLVHFDDGQLLDNPADIVVNGAPGAESLPYRLHDGATALLGPQYLCLDPAIASAPKREPQPEVKNILVSLGYAPDQDLLRRVAVAVSKAAPDAVVQTLHSAPPGMLVLLLSTWADLAITGGGQTMLESVALGVPTIAVMMGENQRAQMLGAAAKLAIWPHWAAWEMPDETAQHAAADVQVLRRDRQQRQAMSDTGRRLIDGRGVERVARVIVERVVSYATKQSGANAVVGQMPKLR